MQKGQALLIILLVMAVVMTVALSVVSYSVSDVSLTTSEEEALRAFSAAEAGIERVFLTNAPATGPVGDATFNAVITNVAEGERQYVYPGELASGESATIWLVSHETDTTLNCGPTLPCFDAAGDTIEVCWGTQGGTQNTALLAEIYYNTTAGDYSTMDVAREASDPDAGRRPTNQFSAPDAGGCNNIAGTTNFRFRKRLSASALGVTQAVEGPVLMRLTPLYNSSPETVGVNVAFGANSNLPGQGRRVDSTGESGASVRKVEVFRLYPEMPSVFSGVFSPPGLIK